MKYFTNIRTLDELKAAYRRLALKCHPDMGGSTEIMQEINAEHDALFEQRERVAAAEASGITEPVKPVCYPAGRWNGKVYGTAAYGYRIYVDNAEVQISGDDADALKKYADALEVWRKAVKAKE